MLLSILAVSGALAGLLIGLFLNDRHAAIGYALILGIGLPTAWGAFRLLQVIWKKLNS